MPATHTQHSRSRPAAAWALAALCTVTGLWIVGLASPALPPADAARVQAYADPQMGGRTRVMVMRNILRAIERSDTAQLRARSTAGTDRYLAARDREVAAYNALAAQTPPGMLSRNRLPERIQ